MISMEDWVTIRNFKKKNPYLGTRAIAKQLKISRNTVKRALAAEVYSRYKERERKANGQVAPFYDFIKESYITKGQKISVIIENLQSKGFSGTGTSVYRFIGEYFKDARIQKNSKTFEPYETEPGEQMQYDWAEYILQLGQISVKVYIHSLILGFSRYRIYEASLDITAQTILSAVEESIFEFNGVCKRIQVDNPKTFVIDASVNNFKWNDNFLNFCGYYGIEPTRSMPRHPWSKGKVERPFAYLEDHFITNETFESFEDLCIKLKKFQQKVNERVHDTTKEKPSVLYAKEKEFLLELPENRFVTGLMQLRSVTKDCLISFKGSKYSAPHHFALQDVWIKTYKGYYLQIYSTENKLIAEHKISLKKGGVVMNKAHYKNYKQVELPSYDILKERFAERFSAYEPVKNFPLLLEKEKGLNPRRHLVRILDMFSYYNDSDCIFAVAECFKRGMFNYHFIKAMLSLKQLKEDKIDFINNITLPVGSVKRDMKEYSLWMKA